MKIIITESQLKTITFQNAIDMAFEDIKEKLTNTIKETALKELSDTSTSSFEKLGELNNLINEEKQKIKLMKQSVVITHEQMDECVQMFKLLGMPTIKAKQEADAQCAYLSKVKLVDAIASEDMDLLTFGTEILFFCKIPRETQDSETFRNLEGEIR